MNAFSNYAVDVENKTLTGIAAKLVQEVDRRSWHGIGRPHLVDVNANPLVAVNQLDAS